MSYIYQEPRKFGATELETYIFDNEDGTVVIEEKNLTAHTMTRTFLTEDMVSAIKGIT